MMTGLLAEIVRSHAVQLCFIALLCLIGFCKGFAEAFRASLRAPVAPERPQTAIDDGWVKQPLQSRAARAWERTTGCTVESRRRK
jgi:hypothetical protein